ncbi:MAG: DUF2007 domain-containing protein [Bacteroides sp.]|nr:DUF2007 domain-containing protein [Bacteroides sp.]MCM1413341.1 DUF2007 domain-containing protein [Bacteroides sp.]MCM1471973.1 DUF2007 domain-containing protein [Bacteroides sp.]
MALTYNKEDNEITLCREFDSDAEAHIAMAALQQEGIVCVIENELFSRIYPVGGMLGGLRLMVHRRDLDKALQIVDSLNFEGA